MLLYSRFEWNQFPLFYQFCDSVIVFTYQKSHRFFFKFILYFQSALRLNCWKTMFIFLWMKSIFLTDDKSCRSMRIPLIFNNEPCNFFLVFKFNQTFFSVVKEKSCFVFFSLLVCVFFLLLFSFNRVKKFF